MRGNWCSNKCDRVSKREVNVRSPCLEGVRPNPCTSFSPPKIYPGIGCTFSGETSVTYPLMIPKAITGWREKRGWGKLTFPPRTSSPCRRWPKIRWLMRALTTVNCNGFSVWNREIFRSSISFCSDSETMRTPHPSSQTPKPCKCAIARLPWGTKMANPELP